MKAVATLSVLFVSATLALGACGGGDPEPKTPDDAAATAPPDTAAVAPPPVDTTPPPPPPAPEAATPPPPPPMTDEQIAAVTTAANNAEIDQAKLAQKQAKNARVKKFAAHMIADHTDANSKQSKLLAKAKITPADSAASTQLQSDASKATDSMKGQNGPDFDKAYMDAQVTEHQQVLDALDNKALPAVKNADFKTLLQTIRDKVAGHLKEAQDIQSSLSAAPAAAPAKKK